MKSSFLVIFIAVLFSLVGGAYYFDEGHEDDPQLLERDIPSFLQKAGQALNHPLYYHKRRGTGEEFYEVKDQKVSITYSLDGLFVEREEDIKLNDLGVYLSSRILEYINREYPGAVMGEVELHTKPDQSLIDVEIKHSSSPTGCWELTFDKMGDFNSLKVEKARHC